MGWNFYGLDQTAQKLVLEAKARDSESLNQAHKMRQAVAYGLERFWGEHIRLLSSNSNSEQHKGSYWKATWKSLAEIMEYAGVIIPNDDIDFNLNDKKQIEQIQTMSKKLWGEIPVTNEQKSTATNEQKSTATNEQKSTATNEQKFTVEDQRITLAVLSQLTDCLVWWTQRYK